MLVPAQTVEQVTTVARRVSDVSPVAFRPEPPGAAVGFTYVFPFALGGPEKLRKAAPTVESMAVNR